MDKEKREEITKKIMDILKQEHVSYSEFHNILACLELEVKAQARV